MLRSVLILLGKSQTSNDVVRFFLGDHDLLLQVFEDQDQDKGEKEEEIKG